MIDARFTKLFAVSMGAASHLILTFLYFKSFTPAINCRNVLMDTELCTKLATGNTVIVTFESGTWGIPVFTAAAVLVVVGTVFTLNDIYQSTETGTDFSLPAPEDLDIE